MNRAQIQSEILQDADLAAFVGEKRLHKLPANELTDLIKEFYSTAGYNNLLERVAPCVETGQKLEKVITDVIESQDSGPTENTDRFNLNDGGRAANGFNSKEVGDCVARAIAIASGRNYREVYDRLAEGHYTERRKRGWRGKKERTASKGIHTKRKWFSDLMAAWGFVWVPTMAIGQGCKVHLKREELPGGRLVVNVSKHFTAMIDGVINDTYDPSRDGMRCVYGYYIYQPKPL